MIFLYVIIWKLILDEIVLDIIRIVMIVNRYFLMYCLECILKVDKKIVLEI